MIEPLPAFGSGSVLSSNRILGEKEVEAVEAAEACFRQIEYWAKKRWKQWKQRERAFVKSDIGRKRVKSIEVTRNEVVIWQVQE